MDKIKIVDCPRDAMQGIHEFIPTEIKAEYINSLLKIGFDTLDFGSFVSPKSIPQMQDTAEVLKMLELDPEGTKLLAIIANFRGAKDACQFSEIKYLGFPFSISESFQMLNINASVKESLGRIEEINVVHKLCDMYNKNLVIYLSMAFGNPYGDEWSIDLLNEYIKKLKSMGIKYIALSDTVGFSTPEVINNIFNLFINEYPEIEFGAHFHSTANTWKEKVEAAYQSGCRRFDGALRGYGGCPLSAYHLVGNIATENIIFYFQDLGIETGINFDALNYSMNLAQKVFPQY
jgi:hydroxymethylglutaryl-CoA lyase